MFYRTGNSCVIECDWCHSGVKNDDVTFFYRGQHFHPECAEGGVEAYKAQQIQPTPSKGSPTRDFKPVDLAINQWGFPVDHLPSTNS